MPKPKKPMSAKARARKERNMKLAGAHFTEKELRDYYDKKPAKKGPVKYGSTKRPAAKKAAKAKRQVKSSILAKVKRPAKYKTQVTFGKHTVKKHASKPKVKMGKPRKVAPKKRVNSPRKARRKDDSAY